MLRYTRLNGFTPTVYGTRLKQFRRSKCNESLDADDESRPELARRALRILWLITVTIAFAGLQFGFGSVLCAAQCCMSDLYSLHRLFEPYVVKHQTYFFD
uniref:Uncharacterized protein n=1 Tax=Romanomermis culicivorax TaxID=13658 RepID=A0A915HHW3_ROMCU